MCGQRKKRKNVFLVSKKSLQDHSTTTRITKLNTSLAEVERGNNDILDTLAWSVDMLVNTLPGAREKPRLLSSQPQYAISRQPFTLQLSGKFLCDSQVYLDFDHRQFVPAIATNKMLEFHIPEGVISSTSSAITFKHGTLFLPYDKELSSAKAPFHVLISVLPSTPGKITLEWQEERIERVFRNSMSDTFHLCSRSECCGSADRTVVCRPAPSREWNIDKDSVSYHIIHKQGKFTEPKQKDGIIVGWTVKTFHSNEKGVAPGCLTFQVRFNEWKDVLRVDKKEKEIPLTWGSKKVLYCPAGTWKIVFMEFGKIKKELIETDTYSSDYLHITAHGNWIVIEAKKPDFNIKI